MTLWSTAVRAALGLSEKGLADAPQWFIWANSHLKRRNLLSMLFRHLYMKHALQSKYFTRGKTVGNTEMSGSQMIAHIFLTPAGVQVTIFKVQQLQWLYCILEKTCFCF